MTWWQLAILALLSAGWIGGIYVLLIEPLVWWLRLRSSRRTVEQLRFRVDHCGMCHGTGEHPAREGYRGHGDPCPTCRGRGRVVRHPGSSSCAGPAPHGARVGSFVGGPAW